MSRTGVRRPEGCVAALAFTRKSIGVRSPHDTRRLMSEWTATSVCGDRGPVEVTWNEGRSSSNASGAYESMSKLMGGMCLGCPRNQLAEQLLSQQTTLEVTDSTQS